MSEALERLYEYYNSREFNKYEERIILSFIDYFKNNDDSETISNDDIFEIVDSNVDIYYDDLLDWLSYDLNNVYYVEDAFNEYGVDGEFDFFKVVAIGQFKFLEEIAYDILNECDIEIKD